MKDLTQFDSHRISHPILSKLEMDKSCGGFFEFIIDGTHYFVVASINDDWQHVSVSGRGGVMPTYDVMEEIKNMFFKDNEFVVEFHPKKEDYVNNVENCLHMWVNNNKSVPYPNMKEVKSGKQNMISKETVIVDGKPYVYVHYTLGNFEVINIKSQNRLRPSWDVACEIKQRVFGDTVAVTYHGRKNDEISRLHQKNQNSITIWRPIGMELITPPSILVGVKDKTPEEINRMNTKEILDLLPEME